MDQDMIDKDQDEILNDEHFEAEAYEYADMLNLWTIYFRQFYCSENRDVFNSVNQDDPTATNLYMEKFYDAIYKLSKSTSPNRNILYSMDQSPKLDSVDDLYLLYIDSEPMYTCEYLIPLLKYLTGIEWESKSWSIVPLK